MRISGGTISCWLITTGSYGYNDNQFHTWDLGGGTMQDIVSTPQVTFYGSWTLSGHGSKNGASGWNIPVTHEPATFQVSHAQNNTHMLILKNTSAGTNYVSATGNVHNVLEIPFPPEMAWSDSLNAPSFFYYRTVIFTARTRYGNVKIPFRLPIAEDYTTDVPRQYIEPGDGTSTAWWEWTINF